MESKQYLGDAVYVDKWAVGNGLILTTEDGTGVPSNQIYLEDTVVRALKEYLERIGFK